MYKNERGFTLIELLVVVLIIGILSAIALPQYTKAVEKTRLSEATQNVAHLQQAIDIYLLANGYPTNTVSFLGTASNGKDLLDIDVTTGMECFSGYCKIQNFNYSSFCNSSTCHITVDHGDYDLFVWKDKGAEWKKGCDYTEEKEYLCMGLESQGYFRAAC